MKKLLILLLGILVSVLGYAQDQAYVGESITVNFSKEETSDNSIYYRPQNVFENPNLFIEDFFGADIPMELYSDEEILLQKELNDKEEGIITISDGDNRFFPREIDREDITPYTWKWVHFQVEEEDGSYTNIRLRRPNSWFIENHATKIGDNVHINIPQIGLDKKVSIVKIYPNQLDTRFWDGNKNEDLVTRPITGKVEHSVNNVVDLHFTDAEVKPLSVTKNHLLWSHDRNTWVKVEDLAKGEKVTTKQGTLTIRDQIDKEGWYIVYDLEVYRDHNFLVGAQNVLAHNGCSKKTGATDNGFYEVVKGGKVDYAGKGPASRSKTSKNAKGGDHVIHYEINTKIADKLGLSVKDASFIMEYKLGLKRARELLKDADAGFKDLPSNGIMSPGMKKYKDLLPDVRKKVDKAFDEILAGGGTKY